MAAPLSRSASPSIGSLVATLFICRAVGKPPLRYSTAHAHRYFIICGLLDSLGCDPIILNQFRYAAPKLLKVGLVYSTFS